MIRDPEICVRQQQQSSNVEDTMMIGKTTSFFLFICAIGIFQCGNAQSLYDQVASSTKAGRHIADQRLPEFPESVQSFYDRRYARVPEILENSEKIAVPGFDESRVFTIRFVGPTMDKSLSDFYQFFANSEPASLRPVSARLDLVDPDCTEDSTLETCTTLSHVAFSYGLLGRYYPEQFTDVFSTLEDSYGQLAVPGLSLEPFESVRKQYFREDSSVQDFYTHTSDEKICAQVRLDDWDGCIVNRTETSITLRTQGLQTYLELSADEADSLLRSYLATVSEEEGEDQIAVQLFESTALDLHARSDRNAGDRLEVAQVNQNCIASFNAAKISEQIGIRRTVFPTDFTLRAGDRYPIIHFFDQFPEARNMGEVKLSDLTHPGFSSPAPNAQEFLRCIIREDETGGHGVFGAALLYAPPIDGFSPAIFNDMDPERIRVSHVDLTNSIVDLLPLAETLSILDGGRTVIANVSLSFPDDFGGALSVLRDQMRGTSDSVLYVVSAGHVDGNPNGMELDPKCKIVPACLGDLENVITVGAVDATNGSVPPKFADFSNYGRNIVSIAAPGVDIVSLDVRRLANGQSVYGYGQRGGNSSSAVFVSAVAASVLAENPTMSPAKVKKIVLANVIPFAGRDGNIHLFGGTMSQPSNLTPDVATGAASASHIEDFYRGPDRYLANAQRQMIDIIPSPGHQEFILYNKVAGGINNEVKCPMHRVIRISKRSNNSYSVFCESIYGQLLFYDSHFLNPISTSGMSCLYQGSACFYSRVNGTLIPIDLNRADEISFSQ